MLWMRERDCRIYSLYILPVIPLNRHRDSLCHNILHDLLLVGLTWLFNVQLLESLIVIIIAVILCVIYGMEDDFIVFLEVLVCLTQLDELFVRQLKCHMIRFPTRSM